MHKEKPHPCHQIQSNTIQILTDTICLQLWMPQKTSPNLEQYVDLFQLSFSSFSLILRILILSANNRFSVLEAARPRHLGKPFDEHQFVLHRKKIIEKQLENMTLS